MKIYWCEIFQREINQGNEGMIDLMKWFAAHRFQKEYKYINVMRQTG